MSEAQILSIRVDDDKILRSGTFVLGLDRKETTVDIDTPSYYHPGRSGSVITKNDQSLIAYFGQIHRK